MGSAVRYGIARPEGVFYVDVDAGALGKELASLTGSSLYSIRYGQHEVADSDWDAVFNGKDCSSPGGIAKYQPIPFVREATSEKALAQGPPVRWDYDTPTTDFEGFIFRYSPDRLTLLREVEATTAVHVA